jgi:hypothetical protein
VNNVKFAIEQLYSAGKTLEFLFLKNKWRSVSSNKIGPAISRNKNQRENSALFA